MTRAKIKLTEAREALGWSKNKLFRESGVANSDIGKIEAGYYTGYPSQRAKLAAALGYEGDPDDLLKEVEE